MADGKWINDLTPETHVADAARQVLTVRLEVVRDCLRLALREADRDVEHVHQLRVGSRRAGAALRIFSSCLPDKVRKAARNHLRQVRRAAGAARDWDVFLLELSDQIVGPTQRQQPGIDFLMGYALSQRVAAQAHLEEASIGFPYEFDRMLAETVAAVHKPHHNGVVRTLLDLARPMLAEMLAKLERAAATNLNDYENLHQVRILGKRLRYAMEVFADCFSPAFREELYPAVEEMQDILGRANDSHVASLRLEGLRAMLHARRPNEWKRCRWGIDALLRFHQQRLPRERKRFLEWWTNWQRSGGEDAFAALLKPAALARN